MVSQEARKRLEDRYREQHAEAAVVFKCASGLTIVALIAVAGTSIDTPPAETAAAMPATGTTLPEPVVVSITHSERSGAGFKPQGQLPGWKTHAAVHQPARLEAMACRQEAASALACPGR